MPARPTAAASKSAAELAVRGGTLVTMDPVRTVLVADILVDADGRIAALADPAARAPAQRSIDASGLVIVPGLIQAHIHLCQTLFRGLAEDMPLLPWLRERIWPLEAAHDRSAEGAAPCPRQAPRPPSRERAALEDLRDGEHAATLEQRRRLRSVTNA